MPQVEYGPPGHKGVTQIMGLGHAGSDAISLIPKDTATRTAGLLSVAVWAGGMVLGSNTAKNMGIGGLLALVYVQVLKKKVPAPTAVPTSTQGWG